LFRRDDLDKSSGGPGINGTKHTSSLGFSDAIRCDGSTDVTRLSTPIEPFGEFLWQQNVTDPAIAKKYDATNYYQVLKARFKELKDSYAIPDPLPMPDFGYQDNWIGEQAMTLLQRRDMSKPFFIEVMYGNVC
jgi:hypothetical protein